MNKEELFAMELHQITEINRHLTVIKVLGGWIYCFRTDRGFVSEFVSSRGKD